LNVESHLRSGDPLQIAEREKERSESQERLLNDQKKWDISTRKLVPIRRKSTTKLGEGENCKM
jgi:hypothetical protein